jgi:hypothetical protein
MVFSSAKAANGRSVAVISRVVLLASPLAKGGLGCFAC